MSETRVLVTGGAGYIGSHACHALSGAGFLPVTVDSLVSGHEWAVKWGPLEVADIRNSAALVALIAKYRPVAVMHFAAHTAVGEAVENPSKYYWNNVGGTLSLLEALRESGLNRLVFSSTAAVYGTPTKKLISEEDELSPINPYGRSKLMSEAMIRDAATAYGLGAVVLRYFNAAGAAPEVGIGQAVPEPSQLIPRVLDAALGRNSALSIFGDDYPTPDGTCVRDFVHVKDLASAHVAAVPRIEPGRVKTFNLGVGSGASVREVIETCRRVTGRAIPFAIEPRRLGDPAEVVADPSRAKLGLGWTAAYTDLSQTIGDAWAWQSSQQFAQLRHAPKNPARK